jgi:hypothetical protein
LNLCLPSHIAALSAQLNAADAPHAGATRILNSEREVLEVKIGEFDKMLAQTGSFATKRPPEGGLKFSN